LNLVEWVLFLFPVLIAGHFIRKCWKLEKEFYYQKGVIGHWKMLYRLYVRFIPTGQPKYLDQNQIDRYRRDDCGVRGKGWYFFDVADVAYGPYATLLEAEQELAKRLARFNFEQDAIHAAANQEAVTHGK
jgi:hypothetical protein